MPINLGPQDVQLSVSQALPAAAASNTTGILDLQSIAPQGDAWRLGRIAIIIPAIVGHTDSTKNITFEIQVAAPSLTNSPIAPALPVPGAFANATVRQIATIPGVAAVGSAAQIQYFTIPFDANGSPFQFVQFVQTVSAGDVVAGQVITYAWVNA